MGTRDTLINIYDLRNPKMPVSILTGHRYGVSWVRFSPFNKNQLVSSSFDMCVIIWDSEKKCLIKKH